MDPEDDLTRDGLVEAVRREMWKMLSPDENDATIASYAREQKLGAPVTTVMVLTNEARCFDYKVQGYANGIVVAEHIVVGEHREDGRIMHVSW
jgi:hypothetical protein